MSLYIVDIHGEIEGDYEIIRKYEEPKTGHCKDCKWWKDSNGFFRRGGRDDKCPINRKAVYDGDGYCYMFESQESEE